MNRVRGYVILAVLAIAGAFFLISGIRNKVGLSNAVDFNEIGWDEVEKNMYVKSSTNMVLDYYCEEVNTRNGVETGKYRWYLVPFSNDEENWHFIGVKVSESRFDNYEKVADDTEAWLNDEVENFSYELNITGRIKECSGEVETYLNEYIDEWEEYNGECENMFVPYYIDLTTTKSSYTSIIVGAIMLAIGVGAFVVMFLSGRKKANCASDYDGNATYTSSQDATDSNAGYTNQEGFYSSSGDELDKILADEERKRQEEEEKKNDPFYQ